MTAWASFKEAMTLVGACGLTGMAGFVFGVAFKVRADDRKEAEKWYARR